MNTKIKMIVLDMDDTLLTDNHEISTRNRKAIKEAQEKGIYVVLASGRPTGGMLSYAKDLELDTYKSYIISYNGGQITEVATENTFFEDSISKEELHELYNFSKEHNTQIITYHNGEIIGEELGKYVKVESDLTGLPFHKVDSFKDFIQFPCVKSIVLEEPEYLKTVMAKAKIAFPHLNITMSKPFFLEIMPKGIDKSTSLDKLANQLNIKPEEIMAVGNADNDLGMVEYAGLGVWVANTDEELKPKGNLVVASNNNDGVAEAIEAHCL